eukprot:gnl/MRDRNA2_/MRDRNA2_136376_c0_seq1.p1 gnl/MRDRNA2_/MRDRNA2_136376_c0~~gnl/MRDRNA2_/MRDRNA2_136376_c0_seq1.p1  ORF type:complete len:230 (-),score=44.57 gnl/MRDRNA2_/MRDRNA2_136376_c0_seq1:3-692(-)
MAACAQHQKVEIASTDGIVLVALVWQPESQTQHKARLAVVMSHPHTKFGGSGNMMHGMARELCTKYGLPCVAFDWRGAGRSPGSSSWCGSAGEIADCAAACNWAVQNLSGIESCVLVGSSGGAPIAGAAVADCSAVTAYVGIGYCFGFLTSFLWGHHYMPLLDCSKQKLFIMGSKDEHTSVSQLNQKAAKAKDESAKVVIVDGVGHYELEQPSYDSLVATHIAEFIDSL